MLTERQREIAAFALFKYQAQTWDLPDAAAELAWERDADLREFWLGQIDVVINAVIEDDNE